MNTPAPDVLTDTLRDAQRVGFLGARPIDEVVTHAREFVAALEGVSGRVLDLGSGGGIPGLVIAVDRPDLAVTLLDRREKRTDFLRRAVRRMGLEGRVDVVTDDVDHFITLTIEGGARSRFDAVVARGFGPPRRTLQVAAGLTAPGGRVVISEPPDGDRWEKSLLTALSVRYERRGAVAVFRT